MEANNTKYITLFWPEAEGNFTLIDGGTWCNTKSGNCSLESDWHTIKSQGESKVFSKLPKSFETLPDHVQRELKEKIQRHFDNVIKNQEILQEKWFYEIPPAAVWFLALVYLIISLTAVVGNGMIIRIIFVS